MFFFYFYISSLYIVPLLSPGTITGLYIYIERERGETDSTMLCFARGSFPGKRVFFGGHCMQQNGAWKCFGGSVLNWCIYRFDL